MVNRQQRRAAAKHEELTEQFGALAGVRAEGGQD